MSVQSADPTSAMGDLPAEPGGVPGPSAFLINRAPKLHRASPSPAAALCLTASTPSARISSAGSLVCVDQSPSWFTCKLARPPAVAAPRATAAPALAGARFAASRSALRRSWREGMGDEC